MRFWSFITLGLQIAQSRYYIQTLSPKVGAICILRALGLGIRDWRVLASLTTGLLYVIFGSGGYVESRALLRVFLIVGIPNIARRFAGMQEIRRRVFQTNACRTHKHDRQLNQVNQEKTLRFTVASYVVCIYIYIHLFIFIFIFICIFIFILYTLCSMCFKVYSFLKGYWALWAKVQLTLFLVPRKRNAAGRRAPSPPASFPGAAETETQGGASGGALKGSPKLLWIP